MPADLALPRIVVLSGTMIGVGKTTATAAVASVLAARGLSVAVIKPVQTMIESETRDDAAWVAEMVEGVDAQTYINLPVFMPPAAGARSLGQELPPVISHARALIELTAQHDVVLVEGSGGLLVRLDNAGGTIADLAMGLRYKGVSTGFILVATANPGTINLTALTSEALEQRGLPLVGVIIAKWPAAPTQLNESNRTEIPDAAGAPLLGVLPEDLSALPPAQFREVAAQCLNGL